ncbi:LysE family translocator [Psychrosphaera sp. 1_MG-2023]|uniref:LysE family translocator n=1 Tax=Psychrosphaera sp. 1_MG-2023 TaxID=3062643 RepID=UPI0026E3A0DB|nr:LysE family translocator [Psychrosphaera sp. 1_MG-2023]MDO6720104.1 LysE family translocator [Psychrosphaera sp. 1_MG-2023]
MTFIEWLPLAFVCLLGAATPGPSLAIILNQTFSQGANAGRLASISHAIAVGIYAVGAILGLSSLFQAVPMLANILITLGALYLIYLGVMLIRSTNKPEPVINNHSVMANDGVKQAFIIAFLNPKLAVFFFALFSQFIPTSGTSITTATILVGTVLFIDMLWYLAIVQIATTIKKRTQISNKNVRLLKLFQGGLFILIAVNALIFTN